MEEKKENTETISNNNNEANTPENVEVENQKNKDVLSNNNKENNNNQQNDNTNNTNNTTNTNNQNSNSDKETNEQQNKINSEQTKNNNQEQIKSNTTQEKNIIKEDNKSPNENIILKQENNNNNINKINEENKVNNNDINKQTDNNSKINVSALQENNNNQNINMDKNNNNSNINTDTNSNNTPNADNNQEDVLSPEAFKKLYASLHSIIVENKRLDIMKQEITTILESITENLINGDKNDPQIFELFSSLNFIQDLILIMKKKNKEVNIQIIKFFSVIMTNLSDEHLIYFLFNCDFINQHIYEDNEPIDGDYLYYYISFVKSLIFKINTKTIGFFYHGQTYSFPLLGNCLKFYNHPDSMISNTIRNIFLCILKMKHQPCLDYICSLPMITYFIFLSCRLRDEIKTLNKKISKNKEEDCMILHEQIINDIMYIQDIFSINLEKINFILINCLFHFLILPIICNTLIYHSDLDGSMNNSLNSSIGSNRTESFGSFFFNFINNNNNNNNANNKNPLLKLCISSELALYILNIFLKYIKNDTFLNLLISLIFLPKIHYKIMNKLKTPIKDLDNYQGDYSNQAKKKVNFVRFITENFNTSFMKAQMNNPNKSFNELKKIETKLIDKLKEHNIPYNVSQPVPFGFLMEIVNSYFYNKELKECREYHEIVSESTGIQCGLSYHKDRKCFIYLMKKNLEFIKNDFSLENIQKKYIDNEIYSSFINSYKDCKDLFLLLSNYLYHQIINNNYISKELLAYVKLLNPKEINHNINNNIDELDNTPALQVDNLIKSKDNKQEKTDKKKFNEVLTFSNFYKILYKRDLMLKEFNLYDNTILSQYFKIGQTEYNATLLGDAISYLNRDDIMKPETYLFIMRLINDLIVYEDNNEKKLLQLRGIHKSIIKNAFIKNIEKIKNLINEGKINDTDLNNIFTFLWGNNNKIDCFEDFEKIVDNINKDSLFLIQKDDNDEKNNNLNNGIDIYNNLIISDIDLKTRIYFLKIILIVYNGLYKRKESDIQITVLNEENKENAKNIILDNLNKLIVPENK